MFRDLKEYQEIAKIYADKVSKPENLEERRGANLSQDQIAANRKGLINRVLTGNPEGKRPDTSASNRRAQLSKERRGDKKFEFKKPDNSASNKRAEMSMKRREMQNKPKGGTDSTGKVIPSTAEIRAKNAASGGSGLSNIPSKEGNATIDGKKINPDFGKKVEVKKEPEVSKFTKQGKERTKAQMMAAKRIASGKSIQDVKDANTASMKAKAAERFKAFKARRLEKKLDKQRDFDDPNKKMNRGESYTPYDIVLEYLLSSEQAATIEEANYIMTEMDAETIQSIVSN